MHGSVSEWVEDCYHYRLRWSTNGRLGVDCSLNCSLPCRPRRVPERIFPSVSVRPAVMGPRPTLEDVLKGFRVARTLTR